MADYLEDAIESVKSQSFTDWELILIDDGSTDRSPQICDEASSLNPSVITVHKKNGGLSSARNAGLEKAKGDFICFLDGDDILPPDALSNLSKWQKIYDADITCGSMHKFASAGPVPSLSSKNSFTLEVLTADRAVEKILYQKGLDNSVSNKLYKARLWKNIRFREGISYEDLDVFYKVFFQSKKVISIPATVYLYRQRQESILHSFSLRRKDVLEVTGRLEEYMREHRPQLLPAAQSRRLSANFNILLLTDANFDRLSPAEKDEAKKLEQKCLQQIKRLRRECLKDPEVRLKNKIGILLSYTGLPLLKILGKLIYR